MLQIADDISLKQLRADKIVLTLDASVGVNEDGDIIAVQSRVTLSALGDCNLWSRAANASCYQTVDVSPTPNPV
jgi:hypothetical protein